MQQQLLVALVMAGMSLAAARADADGHDGHALGTAHFEVSCSKKAQAEFDQAVALLHHMTYPQARTAFEKVAATDPRCAMAHWGIAMTLFQPLWPTRPSPADLQRGLDETLKAQALAPATQRERLFVDSAAAFFGEPVSLKYWDRVRRWEQAMQKVHMAFPQDSEATVFYALAHLAVAPSDRISAEYQNEAAELLLDVYKKNPDHPGAMHYLVHANDVPGREHQLLEIVRKYETVAPDNPHALHMPTHIYTRLGDWDGVIRGNLRAADAALKYPAGDHGQYIWDEFPHAIEYLVYAYLQQGADEKAAEQLKRLQEHPTNLEPTFKTAFHLASTQARYDLERRQWGEARKMMQPVPTTDERGRFYWADAVAWFARGLGAAREGAAAEGRDAITHLSELAAASEKSGEVLFTRQIRILRLGTSAWLAQAEHRSNDALQLMREAAELETSTPKPAVTPAPTLPAYELLGDLLLEQGQAAQALQAYERSLQVYPRRFNSLLGAERAARASGDAAQTRSFYSTLVELAGNGTRKTALDEARKLAEAN